MNKLSRLCLFFALFLTMSIATPKEHNVARGSDSLGSNYLLYWNDNVFFKVNHNTLTAEPFLEVSPEDNHFFDGPMFFDTSESIIYFLEYEGEQYGFRNRSSKITRFDITTQTKEIADVQENITSIAFSPDNSKIVIRHLQPYTEENANRPFPEFCILEISRGNCDYITESLPLHTGGLFWINDRTLWYRYGIHLAIFDRVTGENEVIELENWYVQRWEHLSDEYFFAIALDRKTNETHFIKINVLTKDVSILDYQPDIEMVPKIVPDYSLLSVSPDMNYVVYSLNDVDYQIINLADGSRSDITLGTLANMRSDLHWYPNSEGFLVITMEDYMSSDSLERLVYVEASTGIVTVIKEYDPTPGTSALLVHDLNPTRPET